MKNKISIRQNRKNLYVGIGETETWVLRNAATSPSFEPGMLNTQRLWLNRETEPEAYANITQLQRLPGKWTMQTDNINTDRIKSMLLLLNFQQI